MEPRERLIVALDVPSIDAAQEMVARLGDAVSFYKIGYQLAFAGGLGYAPKLVQSGKRVFLDLKIHDIPNTAQHAVAEAASLGAFMITVHASGGGAMLRACNTNTSLILGVTILTSLNDDELTRIGFDAPPLASAVRLAKLVKESGLRGVVASPQEIRAIRESCGDDFVIVTPGIRPAGSDAGDQQRTMTPRDAMEAGADYIVIGRPIIAASKPRDAAMRIIESL